MTMAAPDKRDDEVLRTMLTADVDGSQLGEQESSEAFAAYQKIEALFDLLRRPATAVEAQLRASKGADIESGIA